MGIKILNRNLILNKIQALILNRNQNQSLILNQIPVQNLILNQSRS